jgi:hypothetical protein
MKIEGESGTVGGRAQSERTDGGLVGKRPELERARQCGKLCPHPCRVCVYEFRTSFLDVSVEARQTGCDRLIDRVSGDSQQVTDERTLVNVGAMSVPVLSKLVVGTRRTGSCGEQRGQHRQGRQYHRDGTHFRQDGWLVDVPGADRDESTNDDADDVTNLPR